MLKVSIPITLSSSFMSIMVVLDTSIVLGRLQNALMYSEADANALFGIYTRGLTVYNLPPALIVPVSVSIVPAIAAAIARKTEDEAKSIMQSSMKLNNLLAMPACAGIVVLSSPILVALFGDGRQLTANVLMILGAASYFVCLQLVTMAILQAHGFERIALLTFPAGAIVRISLSYLLAGYRRSVYSARRSPRSRASWSCRR